MKSAIALPLARPYAPSFKTLICLIVSPSIAGLKLTKISATNTLTLAHSKPITTLNKSSTNPSQAMTHRSADFASMLSNG